MASSQDSNELPRVGQRLRRNLDRGTVRFVGNVPPTAGIWLGVEWDDARNGKHSGVHNGVQYFQCREGAGSFVRPSRNLRFGTSFLRALHHKYVASLADLEVGSSDEASTSYSRKTLADIEVETPNIGDVLKKAARLDRRREVVLDGPNSLDHDLESGVTDTIGSDNDDVAFAFDTTHHETAGDIAKRCPNVHWLDLSRSLLAEWDEVGKIARELRHLSTLLLQGTRLALSAGIDLEAFLQLKDLRLDNTMTTWAEACTIIKAMPLLQSLSLGHNGMEALSQPEEEPTLSQCLESLHFEGNKLSDWRNLAIPLSNLASLRRVILTSNLITQIPQPTAEDVRFATLQHVSLSDNPLSSWSDFDNLNQWTQVGISSLVVAPQSCAWLASLDPRDVRTMLIARLPALKWLNHGTISAPERRDAELYYMTMIEKEMTGQSDQARTAKHPRWLELVERHGRPEALSPTHDQDAAQKLTLRSKLLPLVVHLAHSPPSSSSPYIADPVKIKGASNGDVEDSESTSVVVDLLPMTPLRLLLPKLARALGLRDRGGPRAIESIWALLSPQIDPALDTAVQLRHEMRPQEVPSSTSSSEERIVFELDSLERDLSGYNICPGDELVVVLE